MKMHDEHVVCSRQLHGGGKPKIFSEHVVGHSSRFFCIGIVYVVMKLEYLKTVRVTDEVHKRLTKRAEWSQPLTQVFEELLNIAGGKAKK